MDPIFPGPHRSALEGIDIEAFLADRDRVIRYFNGQADPVSRFWPIPRQLRFGDQTRTVGELRLVDLASIEVFLEETEPDPLQGLNDGDEAGLPERVLAAWRAARRPGPRIGNADGSRVLSSARGRAYVLAVVLGRYDGPAKLWEVLDLVAEATPHQWERFERIAWGFTPAEAIGARVGRTTRSDRPMQWGTAIHHVLQEYKYTLDQVGELTLTQLRALVGGCKPRERSEDFAATRGDVRRFLERHGLEGFEGAGS